MNTREKWGSAFEEKAAVVDTAAEALGYTEQDLRRLRARMGEVGAMEFLYNEGLQLGSGALTGAEGAKVRRQELLKDTGFMERWGNGDVEARAEWSQLNRTIAEGIDTQAAAE